MILRKYLVYYNLDINLLLFFSVKQSKETSAPFLFFKIGLPRTFYTVATG